MYDIGIDLGGTNIKGGLLNSEEKLMFNKSIPTDSGRSPEEMIEDIIFLARDIMKSNDISKESVRSIGIGVPGPVDFKTGCVIKCVNLGWKEIAIKDIMEDALGIPVFVGNDANLAGLAEFKTRNIKNGVMITIGTGIGGAVMIDGNLINGSNCIAAEFGHMVVGEGLYPCSCGKSGCLETFSSAVALIRYTCKLIEEEHSILAKVEKGSTKKINGLMIFNAAKKGDKVAEKAVNRMTDYLGVGIVNIISVIDPEIIIIGGGVSEAGEYLLEKVRKAVMKHRYFKEIPVGKIVLAELGNKAGIIGAAMSCTSL